MKILIPSRCEDCQFRNDLYYCYLHQKTSYDKKPSWCTVKELVEGGYEDCEECMAKETKNIINRVLEILYKYRHDFSDTCSVGLVEEEIKKLEAGE